MGRSIPLEGIDRIVAPRTERREDCSPHRHEAECDGNAGVGSYVVGRYAEELSFDELGEAHRGES